MNTVSQSGTDYINKAPGNAVINFVREEMVRRMPDLFNGKLRRIILFGSCARGDQSVNSDIDIALLADLDDRQLKGIRRSPCEFSADMMDKTYAVVNIIGYQYDEFERCKAWYSPFKNIAKDGVIWYAK